MYVLSAIGATVGKGVWYNIKNTVAEKNPNFHAQFQDATIKQIYEAMLNSIIKLFMCEMDLRSIINLFKNNVIWKPRSNLFAVLLLLLEMSPLVSSILTHCTKNIRLAVPPILNLLFS